MPQLKCTECNSDLKLSIGYTGADYNCENGENSGYEWEISLNCTNEKCAIIYILGYMKGIDDFSKVISNIIIQGNN